MSKDLPTYSAMTAQLNNPVANFSDYQSKTDEAELKQLKAMGVPIEDIAGIGDTVYDDDEFGQLEKLRDLP